MPLRRLTAALACTLWVCATPALTQGPSAPQDIVLTLPQMRVAAAQAIAAGQYEFALSIARAMLVAHPDDSYSHYVIAQVFLRNGQPEEARPAARLSYKLAQTPVQKHESARVAALTAMAQERYLPAQFWMRRALQSAPNGQMKLRAAREFVAARREAKLHLGFDFSVAPSSNVNGGSSEELNTIEGFPLVGRLSPDAQALSGTKAEADLRLRYRLQRSEKSQTDLRGSLFVRRVELSKDAKADAPAARSASYGATLLEFGLTHTRELIAGGPILSGGAFAGRAWFGGELGYSYGRATLNLVQPLTERTSLSFGYMEQEQWNEDGPYSDIRTTGWTGGISHRFANRDQLTLSLSTTNSLSDNTQQTSDRRALRLGYDRARPVGPVRISAGLTASEQFFPDYRVIFPVPGGREDQNLSADLDLSLFKMDYAGFVPTVRLSAQSGTSNVSRFNTETFSISVGFASAF